MQRQAPPPLPMQAPAQADSSHPLALARRFRLSGRIGYRGTAAQEALIRERLERGPATRHELEALVGCGSLTKRISAMRRKGLDVSQSLVERPLPDGAFGLQALYWLTQPDTAQRDLFTDT
ncbi:hypothetical protein [Aquariibacter albus]|uniref:Uncharacterized protein n=1 Tax=Aquariibacter albus TaxID=2759899 RepID=A0A839HNH1_9BURK|nr:hypothetical protein [Aquariibacter albus]MBB1160970.1 hypothetical protein [Aquariibacter albus]